MMIFKKTLKTVSEFRAVIFYYFLYCFLFVLFHLVLVSTFSFFHFLLDHDMSVIENWLSRNTWEILIVSKVISFFMGFKILELNYYQVKPLQKYFYLSSLRPSKHIFGFVFFVLVMFYAFIDQFGGGVVQNQFIEELFYASFIGAFLFYMLDYTFLFVVLNIFDPPKKARRSLIFIALCLFLLSSKIALPYLDKFTIFLMIHFVSLFVIASKHRPADIFMYALCVISPLSSLYGIDIVWDNAYSLFSYQKSLPWLGVFGIWGLALLYYLYASTQVNELESEN